MHSVFVLKSLGGGVLGEVLEEGFEDFIAVFDILFTCDQLDGKFVLGDFVLLDCHKLLLFEVI